MRRNQPRIVMRNANAVKELEDFPIHANQPVEAAQDKAAKGAWVFGPPGWGRGVTAGVKRQHGLAARQQTTDETEAQKAVRQVPADVQMNDIRTLLEQQPHHLERVFG